MAIDLVMPALGMAQETGLLVRWLKRDGEAVSKGEPVMVIETDKITVDIESPASGTLGGVRAREGDVIPVGQTVAWILAPGESVPVAALPEPVLAPPEVQMHSMPVPGDSRPQPSKVSEASPLARKMADEYGVNLAAIQPAGSRIEKADVQAYLQAREPVAASVTPYQFSSAKTLMPASPKARRLAGERGLDLAAINGSGPDGVVLAADVLAAEQHYSTRPEGMGNVWRVMAERMTHSWTNVPHFYLVREVDAGYLVQWRQGVAPEIEKSLRVKVTYTDLLVKLLLSVLPLHPRLNAAWMEGRPLLNDQVNIGIATAIQDGLIVPVLHGAATMSLGEIAGARTDLVERAHRQSLRPADITGGTFTLSNLGMYNVDAFNAIINAPQAAILAVGRIAERVVPINGQVTIRPMMVLTLSCDHRLVDGVLGARFLDDLSNLIENPWRLLS